MFAERGMKQVGRITFTERGENTTMCACVNAIGHAFPPAFIFSRVHFKDHMLKGAPSESLSLTCSSGWMNNELFIKVLKHFITFMNVSINNPGVLVFDNHQSHISLEVINVAEQVGLHIITFPPPCSHRSQPLDVCVFGPFKKFYNKFADQRMTCNPGKAITLYEVTDLSGLAFSKAFTMEKIISAFKTAGIRPFNSQVFSKDMFLPSDVTDVANINNNPVSADEEIAPGSSVSRSNAEILNLVMPHPRQFQE